MPVKEKEYISAILLIGFFGMTILGLSSSSGPQFLHLVPYVFLISAIVVVANNKYQNLDHYVFYSLVLILSLGIHVILNFLNIEQLQPDYSSTLGIQLFGIPLVVPVIWFFLINAVNGILRKFPFNVIIASLIGAFLIVIIDVFLEAQATKFGFWSWPNDDMPLTNFVWWFFISFGFLYASFKLDIRNHTFTSTSAYILMLLFLAASDAISF